MAVPNLRYAAGNSISTTLSSSISNSTLTIPLSSVSGLKTDGGLLVIDRTNAAKKEYIYYTSISGSSAICPSGGRGINSSATAHDLGASVEAVNEKSIINGIIEQFKSEHNDDGTHKQITSMDNDTFITAENNAGGAEIDMFKVNASDDIEAGADVDMGTNNLDVYTITGVDGWIKFTGTFTRTGDHEFTVSGDQTAIFTKGTKVSYDDGSVDYGTVASSSESGGTTTVTLIDNDDYAMAAGTITAPRYSYADNPQGFPEYFNYTPTLGGGGSMTYTSTSITYAVFSINGGKVTVKARISGTTGDTASSYITMTVPVARTSLAAYEHVGNGRVSDGGSHGAYLIFDNTSLTVVRLNKVDDSDFGLGAGRGGRFILEYYL